MNRTPVNSSNLASVGYDPDNKVLEIEFNSGSLCEYYNVPKEEYLNLMNSNSLGKYFMANIRNEFEYRKIK